MRVSRSLRDLAYRALRAREQLIHKLQREPSVDEIAAEIESPREEVVRALDAIQDTVSLYEPIFHDDGDPVFIMDQIRDSKIRMKTDDQSLSVRGHGPAQSQENAIFSTGASSTARRRQKWPMRSVSPRLR